jgi:restriction system protein
MPRRPKEKSPLDEVLEQFEQLPATAGLVTAAALGLVGLALPILIAGGSAGVWRSIFWLFAAVVLLFTASGAVRRRLDRNRFDSTVKLEDLTWSQFEGYLAEYFRRRGASVTYRGGSSADGGVDLVVDDASGRRIVQAKHWKTRRVGVDRLRALWGVLEDERAQGAVVVTSGDFTPDALRFAEGKRLELIGGDQLRRLVSEVKGTTPQDVPTAPTSETCPQCGRGTLQKKLARRGPNAGSYFIACNRFPECRYTRNVSS